MSGLRFYTDSRNKKPRSEEVSGLCQYHFKGDIMEKLLAACGLDCLVCPAYIAAKTNDDELRKKTAIEWTKEFGFDATPEMINCHGCFATDGVLIGHCSQCLMRLCALEKKVANCGACADFPCDKTKEFHKNVPHAKANLEAYRM